MSSHVNTASDDHGDLPRKLTPVNALMTLVVVLCLLLALCAGLGIVMIKLHPRLWDLLGECEKPSSATTDPTELPTSLRETTITETPTTIASSPRPSPTRLQRIQPVPFTEVGDEEDQAITSDFSVHTDEVDVELSAFVQRIWNSDRSRYDDLNINLQNVTNTSSAVDVATNRLFPHLFDLSNRSETIAPFIRLISTSLYTPDTRKDDDWTIEKKQAVDEFYQSYIESNIAHITKDYLEFKGLLRRRDFKSLFYDVWFEPYPRSSKYNFSDSCGFEHVFRGEFRDTKIIGLHSWIQFYLKEQTDDINYYGYYGLTIVPSRELPLVLRLKFLWGTRRKRIGSFFVGTSPEFDLSLYTVCFLSYPNRRCDFLLNNVLVSIQTTDIVHKEGLQLGTAYPE